MEVVLGWNLWVSAVVMLAFTGLYTVLGGMAAVIWTEVLQTVILLLGGVTISIISFTKVGGLEALVKQRPDQFHLVSLFLHGLTY
jgi:Na+/proline symporter